MAKKPKSDTAKQRQYEKEKASIEGFRKMAVKVKPHLRKNGCDLPFYDFLDSWEEEFNRIKLRAIDEFQSLVGIHEVDKKTFFAPNYADYGCDPTTLVDFDLGERFTNYGRKSATTQVNMQGATTYFLDGDGGFTSLVLIPKNPPIRWQYKEFRYAFNLPVLVHELGHVQDAEKRINLDPSAKRFDVVEGEVYANCYALDQLANRYLRHSYMMMYDAIAESAARPVEFEAEIGRLVVERHPRRDLMDWNDFMPE
jgi:hypothetical protein